MSKLKILFICHNHPALHAGGTEIFAHDLFTALKQRDDVEALFIGCTNDLHRERKPGTLFQTVGRSSDEFLMWTGHFERFFQSQIDLHAVVPELTALLLSFRPDVVHFHHSLLIGVETIHLVKRVLPQARVCFTLHEYYAICPNDGQMVTTGGSLCEAGSADACHRCFPAIATDQFVLREQFIKTAFSRVDRFIAPSRFLRERFIRWGLPPERLALIGNGQQPVAAAPPRPLAPEDRRNRFGFFGHINRFKGAMVALQAAALLGREGDGDFTLALHGGLDFQTDVFKADFAAALERAGPQVRHGGGYRREQFGSLVADLDWVVVPSVWWENAPLVIQEAFSHGRPVICSDIGGMAEAVRDGVDGLTFRAGDPLSLARAMRRAITEPELWDRLVGGIRPPRTLAESAADHLQLYRALAAEATRRGLPARRRPRRNGARLVLAPCSADEPVAEVGHV